MFQDPQWMLETMDGTQPYISVVFPLQAYLSGVVGSVADHHNKDGCNLYAGGGS